MLRAFTLMTLMLFGLVSNPISMNSATNPLQKILNNLPDRFQQVIDNPGKFRLQILYTEIERDQANRPSFTTHRFRVSPGVYFYPASTVKLPAVALALERLNELQVDGLDKFTPLRIDSAHSGQTTVIHDSTAENNLPSVAHYIKKILLVSDNDAFNRLYEFLGPQYLNADLHGKGYTHLKIVHRLSSPLSPEENRFTNPFTFYHGDQTLYYKPAEYNPEVYRFHLQDLDIGKGYIDSGSRIERPMDFSRKNYFALEEQHRILQALIFPGSVPDTQRFYLTPDDYRFLRKQMSMLPGESIYPSYSRDKYYDSWVKFFMYGDRKEAIPDNIRIFNKSGMAYGFMIDNAYVVDFQNEVEFLLSAVIYVNENNILNDDNYEYERLGLPFLARLGWEVYQHERTRQREHTPDLSEFRYNYTGD